MRLIKRAKRAQASRRLCIDRFMRRLPKRWRNGSVTRRSVMEAHSTLMRFKAQRFNADRALAKPVTQE